MHALPKLGLIIPEMAWLTTYFVDKHYISNSVLVLQLLFFFFFFLQYILDHLPYLWTVRRSSASHA